MRGGSGLTPTGEQHEGHATFEEACFVQDVRATLRSIPVGRPIRATIGEPVSLSDLRHEREADSYYVRLDP